MAGKTDAIAYDLLMRTLLMSSRGDQVAEISAALVAFADDWVAGAYEDAATIADEWAKPQTLRLRAGEMTRQEERTASAVLRGIAAAIRSRLRPLSPPPGDG